MSVDVLTWVLGGGKFWSQVRCWWTKPSVRYHRVSPGWQRTTWWSRSSSADTVRRSSVASHSHDPPAFCTHSTPLHLYTSLVCQSRRYRIILYCKQISRQKYFGQGRGRGPLCKFFPLIYPVSQKTRHSTLVHNLDKCCFHQRTLSSKFAIQWWLKITRDATLLVKKLLAELCG